MKSHIETDMVTREMERTRDPAGAGKGDAGKQTGRNGQRQKRRKEYREKHTDEERAVGKQRKRGGGESEKWEMGKQPVREEAEKWPGVGTGSESS